jgi:hypothetical protein
MPYALPVLLSPEAEDHVVGAIRQRLGRATLPLSTARDSEISDVSRPRLGTAFWFNELVDTRDGQEWVREYLVTADALTHAGLAEFVVRPELADPPGSASADEIVMLDFESLWEHRESMGVALMGTDGLHAHAQGKGWRWGTQQVTDGIAARPTDVATIGAQPISAIVLGHLVEDPGPSRPQRAAVGRVIREAETVRFDGSLPDGMVGAPVFVVMQLAGDDAAVLRCLGLVLPGDDDGHSIATFDKIRTAVASLDSAAGPADG